MWASEWPPWLYYRKVRRSRGEGDGGGGAAFSPSSIDELFVWHDPSDLTTLFQDAAMTVPVTASDDPVGAMLDKSGNGHHAIQATAGARPLYKTAGGLHWLEFDGIDDFLAVTYGATLVQPWDRVSAIRCIGAGAVHHMLGGAADNAGVLYRANLSTELRIFSGAELTGLTAPAVGTDYVATERHDGVTSRVAADNGAYNEGNAGGTAATGVTIGAGFGGASDWASMRFYESVTVARELTDPETALLRTFNAGKHGGVL